MSAEIVSIDKLLREREWAARRTHYAELSRAETQALSNSELVKGYCATLPEPTAWGRAWYEQRGARLGSPQFGRYRELSPRDLVVMSAATESNGERTVEAVLAILEMDRRTRCEGFVAIGEWLAVSVGVR